MIPSKIPATTSIKLRTTVLRISKAPANIGANTSPRNTAIGCKYSSHNVDKHSTMFPNKSIIC